ncbi:DNA-binding response regulator [Xanthomonas cucurbitae]|nr:DNA-binding response regulator [Xanthomonas cucurbitae]
MPRVVVRAVAHSLGTGSCARVPCLRYWHGGLRPTANAVGRSCGSRPRIGLHCCAWPWCRGGCRGRVSPLPPLGGSCQGLAMSDPISLVVVEDDAHLRAEFERMACEHAGLRWLGGAGSLVDARALLARTQPDVVVVDLGLPDGDGSALIAECAQRHPPMPTLVATIFGDEAHVIRAIEAGARGYLLKDSAADEFVRAIALVHEGGAPLSPHIAKHLLARLAPVSAAPAHPADALTPREIEILTRIAQGFTVSETAEHLQISAHTASTHIKHIYNKLAVNNRVQAVNQARLRGLIR